MSDAVARWKAVMQTPEARRAVRMAEALHAHHNASRRWWQRRSHTPLQWWGIACELAREADA